MASPTRWTWVWVNSGSWWWTGRPGVLWFMGSQRVRHDWATELNCSTFLSFGLQIHCNSGAPYCSSTYGQLPIINPFLSSCKAPAAAKSLQSCPTLCNPIDCNPSGSPVPGILQARTLEWVALSFPMRESEKWKRSRSVVSDSLRPHGPQPARLLGPWDFPGKSTGVGCHFLLFFKAPSWAYLEKCIRLLLCSTSFFLVFFLPLTHMVCFCILHMGFVESSKCLPATVQSSACKG